MADEGRGAGAAVGVKLFAKGLMLYDIMFACNGLTANAVIRYFALGD